MCYCLVVVVHSSCMPPPPPPSSSSSSVAVAAVVVIVHYYHSYFNFIFFSILYIFMLSWWIETGISIAHIIIIHWVSVYVQVCISVHTTHSIKFCQHINIASSRVFVCTQSVIIKYTLDWFARAFTLRKFVHCTHSIWFFDFDFDFIVLYCAFVTIYLVTHMHNLHRLPLTLSLSFNIVHTSYRVSTLYAQTKIPI